MYIGRLVAGSMIRELGLCSRASWSRDASGFRIAAQLGSMRVTEQIDALNTLGTDPSRSSSLHGCSRRWSCCHSSHHQRLRGDPRRQPDLHRDGRVPVDSTGDRLGQIASSGFTLRFIPNDFIQESSRPFVFGGIIAITACYFGMNTKGGTEGVGRAPRAPCDVEHPHPDSRDYFLTQVLLTLFAP